MGYVGGSRGPREGYGRPAGGTARAGGTGVYALWGVIVVVVVGWALMLRQVGYRSYGLRENVLVRGSRRVDCGGAKK